MPLGEVLGRDPPAAANADNDRAEVVDAKRDHPYRDPLVSLEEARQQKQRGADDRGRSEPDKRAVAVGIVATGDGRKDEMKKTDEEVGGAEQHGFVAEGARHRQGDQEHRQRRGEHRQPDAALVDVYRARQ